MVGADIRRFSQDRRGQGMSFLAGIVSAALATAADLLIHPAIVGVILLGTFTDNARVIVLGPGIAAAGHFVGQLIARLTMRPNGRRQYWLLLTTIIRTAALGLIAFVLHRSTRLDSDELIRASITCLSIYAVATGFALAIEPEAVTRAVARERRTLQVSLRYLAGAAASVAIALLAVRVFDTDPDRLDQIKRIYMIAAMALAAAAIAQIALRDPKRLSGNLSDLPDYTRHTAGPVITDSSFLRYLLVRTFMTAAALADPFLLFFVFAELGIEPSFIGFCLLALAAGRFVGALIWEPTLHLFGSRSVLQMAALVHLTPLLLAVLLPYLMDTPLWEERVTFGDINNYLAFVIYALLGIATEATARGSFAHLMAIEPPPRYQSAASVAGFFLGIVAFAPVLGAIVLEETNYERLFLTAGVLGLLAIFLSGLLADPAPRASRNLAAPAPQPDRPPLGGPGAYANQPETYPG